MDPPSNELNKDDFHLARRWTQLRCLNAMSTDGFSKIISNDLQTNDIKVGDGIGVLFKTIAISAESTFLFLLNSNLRLRIISHFRNCVEVAKKFKSRLGGIFLTDLYSTDFLADVQDEIINVFYALFKSISVFWGIDELQLAIKYHLNGFPGTSKTRIHNLTKQKAMRTPGAIILPTLSQIWTSIRAVSTTVSILL